MERGRSTNLWAVSPGDRKLLTMTPANNDDEDLTILQDNNRLMTYRGLAQRTGEILRRMELCAHPALILRKRTSDAAGRRNNDEEGDNFDAGPSQAPDDIVCVGGRSSYQNIYPDYPRHLSDNIKFALPIPTRAIYNMVLLRYAKESAPLHIAQQAEDVIWSMITRALYIHRRRVNNDLTVVRYLIDSYDGQLELCTEMLVTVCLS